MSTPEINSFTKITVMHVDDSAIVRRMVTGFFDSDDMIEVIATAENGIEALNQLNTHSPDVVILDIEMPEMDGITALPKILEKCPHVKVIMCSTLTERGAAISMQALSLGATECIAKPTANSTSENKFGDFREDVVRTVKGLFPERQRALLPHGHAKAQKETSESQTASLLRSSEKPEKKNKKDLMNTPIGRSYNPSENITIDIPYVPQIKALEGLPAPTVGDSEDYKLYDNPHAYTGRPEILAIGSSTGGPQALFEVFKSLTTCPVPIVVTQHMPPTFTKLLAEHIEQNTNIKSHEGQNGMVLQAGHVYIAPGGFHMTFKRNMESGNVEIVLNDGPQINFCKPAVDPMFESLIEIYGRKILAVILTGMGQDGLLGSQKLVQKNGRVIAQNKETCTVWGMPRAVTLANICTEVLPLKEIGPWLKTQI